MDNSPLIKLPAELRNGIFAMAMRAEPPIEVISKQSTNQYRITYRGHALTQTCKQLRQENLAMSYANSTFNLNLNGTALDPLARRTDLALHATWVKAKLALKWLQGLPREMRQVITCITMTMRFEELWLMVSVGRKALRAGGIGGRKAGDEVVELSDELWYMGNVCELRCAVPPKYHGSRQLKEVDENMSYLGFDFRPVEYEWDGKGETPEFLKG